MKPKASWFKWSGVALITFMVGSAPIPAFSSGNGSKDWAASMKGLEKALQELLLDLNNDKRFSSTKNFGRIEKNAEKFAKLAHELKVTNADSPDADPTIQIIAGQFSDEAKEAYKLLASGHRDYAREKLRSMTGYCMACHTRNSNGPSFQGIIAAPAVQSLRGLERADFFTSTRHFDRALDEYEKLLSEPANVEHRVFDWEKAIRAGLAISVRVKKDPERSLSIIDRVLAAPKAPFFLREQAIEWKKSLNAWKAEGRVTPQTEEGYYAHAIKLLGDARALQKYPADRSADVLYLRASSAVHDLLSFAPNGKYATDALYLAGLCYEVLHDLNLWDQHEFYYLACIKRSPHTEIARQCFKHYEQSVFFGYTGSGGTHIPSDVGMRLKYLELLSTPSGEGTEVPRPLQ
jgi:hypothetical protein